MLSSSMACGNVDELARLDAKSGEAQADTRAFPSGSLITVRGWAALSADPKDAAGVFAMIDGGPPIEVVHCIERPDVAAAKGDDGYLMTGFRGTFSTSHLSLGSHSLRIAIRSSDGAFIDIIDATSFAIVESLEQRLIAAPKIPMSTPMAVDEIRIGNRTLPMPIVAVQRDILHIKGWAIDESARAVAHAMYAIVESSVILADYGEARPDVAAQYRDKTLINCGFALDIPLYDIEPGHHTIRLRVVGADEYVIYEGSRITIDVARLPEVTTPSPDGVSTLGVVDKVAVFDMLGNIIDPPAPLTLMRGNLLFLSGWAIDERRDGVARAVQACVDDNVSAAGVYGLARNDVAQHFSRPDLAECGFTVLISTASLQVGVHSAVVRVIDVTGSHFYELEQAVQFTVIERNYAS